MSRDKKVLVADVGGTNARLALIAKGSAAPGPPTRFTNRDFGGICELLAAFLDRHGSPEIAACTVAMAGPVHAGRGRLTNLDWEISAGALRRATGAPRAIVINDLTALGYAIGEPGPEGLTPILDRAPGAGRNGQSLVVGIGTGFNVCPVGRGPAGAPLCFEAEGGHIGLSPAVLALLADHVGGATTSFQTAEDLFSGRGLARFHQLRIGAARPVPGEGIVTRHASGADPAATLSLRLFVRLIAAHCRELMLQYLPLDGIVFAGSVARGVFGAGLAGDFAGDFASELDRHARFGEFFRGIPVSIIRDDAAALVGCAVASRLA